MPTDGVLSTVDPAAMEPAAPEPAVLKPPVAPSVPSFAFNPSDPWTVAFQAGLERADLRGRCVYEVGVGSGINVAFMLRQCAASVVLGSDLDPRLPELAGQFVAAVAPDLRNRFYPIPGSVNLIDVPATMAEVATADVVVACLPQVPDPLDAMSVQFRTAQLRHPLRPPLRIDDHMAHYYPWAAFNDYPYNAVGLGLIEALLRRVQACVPRAQVVLSLGCRIGKEVLLQLFRSNGYQPEELANQVVRQDERTDISFFVALEAAVRGTDYETAFSCEFYSDPLGRDRISANEAKRRLDIDPVSPVYHEICVLRGHPDPGLAIPEVKAGQVSDRWGAA